MPSLYPDAIVNDVLDRSNIVEVVSSYLPLKRAGRNFKANCPFHPEKTPSFIVSADKQIYHCFGCGAGGNALSFVMQYERVGFREALQNLAQRSGVSLPEPERTPAQKQHEDLSQSLYGLYEKAAAFYHALLLTDDEAKEARSYLQKRGIFKETAQRFKIGFARNSWDALIQHLKKQSIPLSLIEKSGLAVAKEGGGTYDRFRNRIIFPITNLKDRVIGFGARVTDASLPKYINSPETPIYTKGKNLFGLNIARDAVRAEDTVIVVEGYLDMILPYEAGIKNIAASLGTALTIDQVRLLKRFTNNIVMLYDADLAGESATLRALELLIEEDVQVRIARLPKEHDPDSFVRVHGEAAFRQMIREAKPIFDYKLEHLLSKFDATTTTGKDRIVREILPTVKKFPNHTLRSDYMRRTAQALGLDEQALWEDFKTTDVAAAQEAPIHAVEHFKLTEIPITERMLVKLMLDEMHLIDKIKGLVSPEDFVDPKLRKIVDFIFRFFCDGKDCRPNILMNHLGDEEAINIIAELATLDIHDCPNKEKLIADCLARMKRDKILYRCQELCREMQNAQTSGATDKLDRLTIAYNDLIKQRSKIHGETSR